MYQPLRPDLQTNSNMEYFTKRQQEICPYRRTTKEGSNGLNAKVKCKDCGKLLSDEKTPAGLLLQQKKSREAPTTQMSQSSLGSQRQMEQDNKDFQHFLMWKRAQEENQGNQASSSNGCMGLFM